jgi:hypothetical protein
MNIDSCPRRRPSERPLSSIPPSELSTLVRSDPSRPDSSCRSASGGRGGRPGHARLSVEVQAARLSEARVEFGNREVAAPLAPTGRNRAAEGTLARVGPTTRMALA